ncbi:MAG: tRNA dihydrouridine synthase DusB [Anaerolineae bacterium]|nr:tRNA dihydrouridine synthase DusB [Anaerolineae bacterium]
MCSQRELSGTQAVCHIGSVPLYGDLALAPMVGFSDVPYRLICREHGSALSYTPLMLDQAIIQKAKRGKPLIDFVEEERPLAVQLLSADADTLAQAARILTEQVKPDLLDLNMGCPVQRVVSRGRGAALLREPAKAGRLMEALVGAAACPVTAKIRLGWTRQALNHLHVARVLEQAGASAIAVHGRTRAQGYSGEADWQAIAEVSAAVAVPVMANGDVRSVADIEKIKEVTGAQIVLIGRAAVGNPWIFSRRDLEEVSYEERLAMVAHHLRAMVAHYGEELGVILFRKHAIRYTRGLPGSAAIRAQIVRTQTCAETLALLDAWSPTA